MERATVVFFDHLLGLHKSLLSAQQVWGCEMQNRMNDERQVVLH